MAICNQESKLSDLLLNHPSLIPVIGRMGIELGVGDYTIAEICAQHEIRSEFMVSIINTFLDEEYFPSEALNSFSLEKTVSYLERTGDFYLHVQLPNIEVHFNRLIDRSGSENNLKLLQRFFLDMKNQLSESIVFEKEQLFPALKAKEFKKVNPDHIISVNSEIEEKLHDLLTFFVVHLKGSYDRNLCMAVVSSVFALSKDVRQNNRIRTRILLPLMRN